MEHPELLTVREAADMAGYTTTTVYRWIELGLVKAHRFGKLRLLDKAAFVSFIATYVPPRGPCSKSRTQV